MHSYNLHCFEYVKHLTHWRSQKFWLGGVQNEKNCDVSLVTIFGYVITMTSLKYF